MGKPIKVPDWTPIDPNKKISSEELQARLASVREIKENVLIELAQPRSNYSSSEYQLLGKLATEERVIENLIKETSNIHIDTSRRLDIEIDRGGVFPWEI